MTPDDLRKIAEAATKGPWEWERPSDEDWPQHDQSLISTGKKTESGYPETVLCGWGYDASGTEAYDEDRQFIATFNPKRVLELLDQIERLRDQNARLKAGNHTPAERENWRARFIETHDNNQTLRARLTAIEKLHQPHTYDDEPDVRYCGHCQSSGDPYAPTGRTWPCPTIKAARGE